MVELNSSGIFSVLDVASQDKKSLLDEEKMKASAVDFRDKISKSVPEPGLSSNTDVLQITNDNLGASDKDVSPLLVGDDIVGTATLGTVNSFNHNQFGFKSNEQIASGVFVPEVIQADIAEVSQLRDPNVQVDSNLIQVDDGVLERVLLDANVTVALVEPSIVGPLSYDESLIDNELMKFASDGLVLEQSNKNVVPFSIDPVLGKEISDLSVSVGEILSSVGVQVNKTGENSSLINVVGGPLNEDGLGIPVGKVLGFANPLSVGASVPNVLVGNDLSVLPAVQEVEMDISTAFKVPNSKLFDALDDKFIDLKVSDFISSLKSPVNSKVGLLALGVPSVSAIADVNSVISDEQLSVVNSIDFKSTVEKQHEASSVLQNSKEVKHKVLESRLSDLGVVIKKSIQEGLTSLKINLSPSELGGIEIKLVDVNGDLTLRFKAEKPETLALLGQNEETLGDLLSSDSFGDKEFSFHGVSDSYPEDDVAVELRGDSLVSSHDGLISITV